MYGRRRVEEVAKIAAVEVDEVIVVAEAFRRSDCRFLAAPEGPLRADTLLDVSHESLIRQWQRPRAGSRRKRIPRRCTGASTALRQK